MHEENLVQYVRTPFLHLFFAFSTTFYFIWQLFHKLLRFWKSQIRISLKMTSKSSLWDPNKVIQSCNEVQVGPESLRLDFYHILNLYDIFCRRKIYIFKILYNFKVRKYIYDWRRPYQVFKRFRAENDFSNKAFTFWLVN